MVRIERSVLESRDVDRTLGHADEQVGHEIHVPFGHDAETLSQPQ